MKNRIFIVMLLLVLLTGLTGNAYASPVASPDTTSLVYINLDSQEDLNHFAATHLPLYARLEEGILSGVNEEGAQALLRAGLTYQVLDADISGAAYYLVKTHSSRPAPDYRLYGKVLLSLNNGVLIRMNASKAKELALAGGELMLVTLTPKPLPEVKQQPPVPTVVDPDPIIQGIIDQVSETQVYTYDRQLAGELPVWVDGDWYTILTRETYSGEPMQKTTHYVGERFAADGLDVEYHVWSDNTNPNVIGEITGLTNPDDIYIIGAHLDDVGVGPGADDNASGSVATLLAADILSKYQWNCTLRFALWTGEEWGLLGSEEYAQRSRQMNENIIGYVNLDMIAWNTIGTDPHITLSYSTAIPQSHDLALLFQDVINAYDINLLPLFSPNLWGSDHNSFWDYNYNAILGIEEDPGDFNPYYHGPGDTPAHTDPEYFTNFVKAGIGTFAHLTNCLVPETEGALNGHVTAADSGVPLENANVTAENGVGDTYPAITDASGYYTMTLPMDTYTVTVAMDGYITQTQTASVVGGLVTTLDFGLETVCEPVSGLDFTWLPAEPYNGDVITFTATVSGSEPIDFSWNFGDTYTGTGSTVTHSYDIAGAYTVAASATNACSSLQVSKDVTVLRSTWDFFLPLIHR